MLTERAPGSLPGNTETNPKEQVKAVTLRSGKELQAPARDQENKKEVGIESEGQVKQDEEPVGKSLPTAKPREYQSTLPYPARLRKNKDNEHYKKFLELFKQLHINLPLVEALGQMPKYAKFLKELLSNKRKLEELSTVTLGGECSAVILNKLPRKLKDPGSFTIPCLIGDLPVERALADLGASINLMPYSMFKRLNLGEPKSTRMSIQLADRSMRFPRGVVEDVLVKVHDFIFPADFVVLDMDEDIEVPLILGRPFLATAGAVIDVKDGKLVLRVGSEEMVIRMPDVFRKPMIGDDTCFLVDSFNLTVSDCLQETLSNDPLELCLSRGSEVDEIEGVKEIITRLEACAKQKKDFGVVEIN